MIGLFGLFRKELRTLWPLLGLGVFLISGDFLTRPFTERLDESTYTGIASIDPGEGSFIGFFQLLLGFIVAYAAFPREHDERTIELLYALPISRPRIFLGKVLGGLTTLATICVLGQVTNALLVMWNVSSFERTQLTFELAMRVAFLHTVTAAVGYGHGLFASVFRRFGILPYVFLGYGISVVVTIVPALDVLDPLRLSRTEYVGTTLVIPWAVIAGHLLVAATMAALAYVLWLGSFERLQTAITTRNVFATIGFGCMTALAVFGGLGVLVFLTVREYGDEGPPDPDAVPEPEGVDFLAVEARSEHYEFVYPESFRDDALRLISRSDAILERAGAVVGTSELPHVTVDLAEESSHHEGIAASSRIRMGVVGSSSWRLAHVLAHESTHVLQNQESDLHLADHGETTRFFVEGSAEWVAFEVTTAPDFAALSEEERRNDVELRAISRIVATASAERHHIRIEDLWGDTGFRARWDTVLAYPLGETLAEAIARGCSGGDRRGVGDFMRAFARPDAPQDATGEALVRDALQSFGCDYERVIGAWDGLLHEIGTTDRARIDAIPRLSGGVIAEEGGDLVIEATLDRPPLEDEHYTVRYRRNELASDLEVSGARGSIVGGSVPRRVRFRVPRAGAASGARFQILFSVDVDERAFPFSEAWQSALVP